MIESQLRTLFTEIARGEQGPSQVDTQLAHRRGRGRLRWRRAGVASAPVAAAAAVVAVVLAVGAAAPPGSGTGPVIARPAAPRQFSPLDPYLSFGWLPAGDKLVQGGTSRGTVWLTAAHRLDAADEWSVGVFAAGKCHLAAPGRGARTSAAPQPGPTPAHWTKELKCSAPEGPPTIPITSRAPAIRGRQAFWGLDYLVWQYARDGWAELNLPVRRLGSPLPAAMKRDAVDIAEHVRYGAPTPPLLFPLQLTHLPSRWQVSSLTYLPTAGVLGVRTYSLGSGRPNLGADGGLVYQTGLPYFNILPISPRTPCYVEPGHSTVTVINGYRVVVSYELHGIPLRHDLCTHARGLALYMSEFAAHPPISLADLFGQHLRLLGRNPANWTPNPIR